MPIIRGIILHIARGSAENQSATQTPKLSAKIIDSESGMCWCSDSNVDNSLNSLKNNLAIAIRDSESEEGRKFNEQIVEIAKHHGNSMKAVLEMLKDPKVVPSTKSNIAKYASRATRQHATRIADHQNRWNDRMRSLQISDYARALLEHARFGEGPIYQTKPHQVLHLDLLLSMVPEFEEQSKVFADSRHIFYDSSAYLAWPCDRLQKTLEHYEHHYLSISPAESPNSMLNDLTAAKSLNLLAVRATPLLGIHVGPHDTWMLEKWISAVYEILKKSKDRESLINRGTIYGVPFRELAIDPFRASAIAIKELAAAIATMEGRSSQVIHLSANGALLPIVDVNPEPPKIAEKTYSPAEIADRAGVGSDTVGTYRSKAGVRAIGRGQKNGKHTAAEAVLILEELAKAPGRAKQCQEFIAEIKSTTYTKSENNPN